MKSAQSRSAEKRTADSAGWKRARRPEQKAERRLTILEAAKTLLDEEGVEGATLSEIARRAGLSKANCYRYFESREAILLELIIGEARDWAAEVLSGLEPFAGSRDVDAVAQVFARVTANRPRLGMLFSSLSSVLERNVSVEAVAEFKRSFNPFIFSAGDGLRAAVPELTNDQADTYLVFLGLFLAGTWPNANPAPTVAEVLEREEFAAGRVELEPTLLAHSQVVLRGLLAERTAEPDSSE